MPGATRVTRVMQELAGKLCHLSHSVYKISNHSSMIARGFDKKIFLLLPNAHSAKSAADSLTKQRTAIKLKGSYPQFFCL